MCGGCGGAREEDVGRARGAGGREEEWEWPLVYVVGLEGEETSLGLLGACAPGVGGPERLIPAPPPFAIAARAGTLLLTGIVGRLIKRCLLPGGVDVLDVEAEEFGGGGGGGYQRRRAARAEEGVTARCAGQRSDLEPTT